jgi:hypothetical protein
VVHPARWVAATAPYRSSFDPPSAAGGHRSALARVRRPVPAAPDRDADADDYGAVDEDADDQGAHRHLLSPAMSHQGRVSRAGGPDRPRPNIDTAGEFIFLPARELREDQRQTEKDTTPAPGYNPTKVRKVPQDIAETALAQQFGRFFVI